MLIRPVWAAKCLNIAQGLAYITTSKPCRAFNKVWVILSTNCNSKTWARAFEPVVKTVPALTLAKAVISCSRNFGWRMIQLITVLKVVKDFSFWLVGIVKWNGHRTFLSCLTKNLNSVWCVCLGPGPAGHTWAFLFTVRRLYALR